MLVKFGVENQIYRLANFSAFHLPISELPHYYLHCQSRSIHVALLFQPNPLHMIHSWIPNGKYPHDTCAQPYPVQSRAYRPKIRTISFQFTVDRSGTAYNPYEPIPSNCENKDFLPFPPRPRRKPRPLAARRRVAAALVPATVLPGSYPASRRRAWR